MKTKLLTLVSIPVTLFMALFFLAPIAHSASTKNGPVIQFNDNGSVIATEAVVTSIYGNYIEAHTDITNSSGAYWQITANGTSSINVGDKIALEGQLKQFGRWSDIVLENTTVIPLTNANSKLKNSDLSKENRGNKDTPIALFYRDGSVVVPQAEVKIVTDKTTEARSPLTNGMYWIAKTASTSTAHVGDMISLTGQLEAISKWGLIFLTNPTISPPITNTHGLQNAQYK